MFENFFGYNENGSKPRNLPKKGIGRFLTLYFSSFWKLTIASIWCWLLNLPVFTGGLASVGMTNIARNVANERYSFGTSDFFATVKKHWKQALLARIINLLIPAVLGVLVYLYYLMLGDGVLPIALVLAGVLLLIFVISEFYIWNLMITFAPTVRTLYATSLKLVFVSVKKTVFTLLALGAYLFVIAAVVLLPISGVQFVLSFILLILFPGYRYFAISYHTFPVIRKYVIDPYYAEHPNEDLELRRDLNILD